MKTNVIFSTAAVFFFLVMQTAVLGGVTDRDDPPSSLTLEDALAVALENNHEIRIQDFARQVSRNSVFRGNAGQLPTLDLVGSAEFARDNSELELADFENEGGSDRISVDGAESLTLSAGVELNYTIFDGFSGRFRYRRLQAEDRITQLSTQVVIEQTLVGVAAAYFNVLEQEERLSITEDNLAISETRLETLREAQRFGNARRVDVLTAEVNVNADKISLEDARNRVAEAYRELLFLLGMDPQDSRPELNDGFSTSDELSLDTILSDALTGNSRILLAGGEKELAATDRRLEGSSRYPSLTARARYGYLRQENDAGVLRSLEETGYTATLNLRFNLYNGGRTSRAIQNARINERSREENKLMIRKEVEKEILNRFGDFETSRRQLEISELNVETAELNLEAALEANRAGQITSTELREAQLNLLEARLQQNELSYLLKLQELELLVLSGRLMDEV